MMERHNVDPYEPLPIVQSSRRRRCRRSLPERPERAAVGQYLHQRHEVAARRGALLAPFVSMASPAPRRLHQSALYVFSTPIRVAIASAYKAKWRTTSTSQMHSA